MRATDTSGPCGKVPGTASERRAEACSGWKGGDVVEPKRGTDLLRISAIDVLGSKKRRSHAIKKPRSLSYGFSLDFICFPWI